MLCGGGGEGYASDRYIREQVINSLTDHLLDRGLGGYELDETESRVEC